MEFYIRCGRPRYQLIIDQAARLQEFYPELDGLRKVTFSKSTISMILHGRRVMLPDPMWVACFVLCCQRLAVASGHLPADPGRTTLPGWQAALSQANDHARSLGLPVRHSPSPSPRPPAGMIEGTAAPESAAPGSIRAD